MIIDVSTPTVERLLLLTMGCRILSALHKLLKTFLEMELLLEAPVIPAPLEDD